MMYEMYERNATYVEWIDKIGLEVKVYKNYVKSKSVIRDDKHLLMINRTTKLRLIIGWLIRIQLILHARMNHPNVTSTEKNKNKIVIGAMLALFPNGILFLLNK